MGSAFSTDAGDAALLAALSEPDTGPMGTAALQRALAHEGDPARLACLLERLQQQSAANASVALVGHCSITSVVQASKTFVEMKSGTLTLGATRGVLGAALERRGRPPELDDRAAGPKRGVHPERLDGTGAVALAARSPERLLELVPRERRARVSSLSCDRLGAGDGGQHGGGVAAERRRRRAGRRHRARGRRLDADGGHDAGRVADAERRDDGLERSSYFGRLWGLKVTRCRVPP